MTLENNKTHYLRFKLNRSGINTVRIQLRKYDGSSYVSPMQADVSRDGQQSLALSTDGSSKFQVRIFATTFGSGASFTLDDFTISKDSLCPIYWSQDTGEYRFGFNGKENDNEIIGTGRWQDYGERMYRTDLGRFFSPDPIIVYGKKYPELSTYQFASNTPISAFDLDGLEAVVYTTGANNLAGTESHQHTVIAVLDEQNILTVWSYGRYTISEGAANVPGVLLKFTGRQAEDYLREEFFPGHKIGDSKAFYLPSAEANEINDFFETKLANGTAIPDDMKSNEVKNAESDKSPGTFTAAIINQYNAYVGKTCVGITQEAMKRGGINPKKLDSPKEYSKNQKVKGLLAIQWTIQVFTARLTETSINRADVVEDVTNQENQDTGKTLKKLLKTK